MITCYIFSSKSGPPLIKSWFHVLFIQFCEHLVDWLLSTVFASDSLSFILFFCGLDFCFYLLAATFKWFHLHHHLLFLTFNPRFGPLEKRFFEVSPIHFVYLGFKLFHYPRLTFGKISPFLEILPHKYSKAVADSFYFPLFETACRGIPELSDLSTSSVYSNFGVILELRCDKLALFLFLIILQSIKALTNQTLFVFCLPTVYQHKRQPFDLWMLAIL